MRTICSISYSMLSNPSALAVRPGVEDIVEYETRLNYVLPKYDDAVC
jgi:hypothetical protein